MLLPISTSLFILLILTLIRLVIKRRLANREEYDYDYDDEDQYIYIKPTQHPSDYTDYR